jgi:hypothetical protein
LGEDQQSVPVITVGDEACKRSQDESRDLTRETHNPEDESRVSQPIDEPAHSDLLHPGPYQGDALAGKEQTKIPVSQGPENVIQIFLQILQRHHLCVSLILSSIQGIPDVSALSA